jgi:spermidine/putrescine transport system permease protein
MNNLIVSKFMFSLLTAFFCVALIVIYLPIIVMIVFSFNSGKYQTLPFREPTFEWYVNLIADSSFINSFFTSLMMASLASVFATILGFLAAYAFSKAKVPAHALLFGIVVCPLVIPMILIGIGMRLQIVSVGIQPALWLVLLGQTLYVLPLAVINLKNRIDKIPKSMEEASISLGSTRLKSIVLILAPICAPSLFATLLLTFTFSFDEFVIAYFLTNFEITLPIRIWTSLVTGFEPKINAVGTAVFIFSVTLGLIAQFILLFKQAELNKH